MDIKPLKTTIVKTNHIIIKQLFFGCLATILLLAACKKKDDVLPAARLFRPVINQQLQSDGNWITASWMDIKDAASYTVQISRDTFRTIDQTLQVDTNTVTFENLQWNQLYQVQVRANAADTTFNSKMSFLGEIKTPKFPTILNTPTSSDVNDEAIKVSWTNSGAAVTSIKVLKATDSSLVKEVTLTANDIANQYKIITGLASSTTYIAYLYSGTTVRGFDNYTTKAPLSGNLIDLRNITDRPLVLNDTLPVIPSGSVVILKRGQVYEISSPSDIDKTLSFISGSDLSEPNPATIHFTSNLDFASGSTLDSLTFTDIEMVGADFGGSYVMNISNSTTIGSIVFNACRIKNFRGVARIKASSPVTITNFTINNCIIDSISGYGVLTVDNSAATVNNFTLQNSTVYKAQNILVSKSASNSVIIESCTFNEAPLNGNYFINYNGNDVTMPVKISNCILGVGWAKVGSTATDVRGYKAGGNTSMDVSGTYSTADRNVSSNALPNVIPYSRPSTELWQDPANGNFTISDNSFPGRNNAGDPRWRP